MPEMVPELLKLSPGGRLSELIDQVNVPSPPVAVSDTLYSSAALPALILVVVILGKAITAIDRVLVAVKLALDTWTVKKL
jgi:hypothetical protein